MNGRTDRLLYWSPRLLCLAFAAFLSVFALDVFSIRFDFWGTALALTMHLVPTFVVLLVLALVWRHEWIGGLVFPLLALFHLVSKWGRLDLAGYVVIEGPLLLLGLLFWLNWRSRVRLRTAR